MARVFPGVEDSTSYGTPALKVRKKLMMRLREDGDTLVVRVGFDDREILMQARPETFFITEHYKHYPAVLVKLSGVEAPDVSDVVEISWRMVAPSRLIADFDA